MADAGEEGKRGKRSRKMGSPGKKARKAKAGRRRRRSSGRRRVHLIVAIANPLRRRILRVIHDWGEPVSPIQIARELCLPIGTVAYHANVLRRLGAVEPAGEQQVRGAVEHLHDSTIEDDPTIEALPEETREGDDEDEQPRS
jgi:DNA-binding transcriptional ArsR family regulator